VKYSATPCAINRLPPRLGEHGAEILAEAGLTVAQIESLKAMRATL
jgi:crotonobetainyl-CoA:carnitine CoA-transferase CaiB-like acyl-CoA transferase